MCLFPVKVYVRGQSNEVKLIYVFSICITFLNEFCHLGYVLDLSEIINSTKSSVLLYLSTVVRIRHDELYRYFN